MTERRSCGNLSDIAARFLVALPLLLICGTGQTATADDAAGCAAFYLANRDFEVLVYQAKDRDPTWKRQADGFIAVARRQGLTRDAVERIIAAKRTASLVTIEGYMLRNDRLSRRIFSDRAEICNSIIRTAPEMRRYR